MVNATGPVPLDLYRAIPVSILLVFIDFITVFGNILVILAVLRTRTLRQMTCNYYIVSLAVSDLLLGICVLPFSSVSEVLQYWIFPSFFCVIWLSTDVLSCTASILNLLCISVDRYLAISRPLQYYKYSSPKFVFIMIAAAWLLSILISVAPVFGFDQSGLSDYECKVGASGLFWTLYSSVGSFFLPLCVMLFLYYRIYLVAAKHSKFMKEERERFTSFALQRDEGDDCRNMSIDTGNPACAKSDNPRVSRVTIQSIDTPQAEYQIFAKDSIQVQSNAKKSTIMKKLRRMSKDKKAAKTLFIVMACFIGCWLPFFTVYLIDGICKEVCAIKKWIFTVNFWLGYCNSMLNPVIYAANSHDFRTAFRKILRCSTNSSNMDSFGDFDHRTQFSPSPIPSKRPFSTGLSETANRLRHTVAAQLIRRTGKNNPEVSTIVNRLQLGGGENHPLVVQQENGLKPITALGQVRETANEALETDCNTSLGSHEAATADAFILDARNPNANPCLSAPTCATLDAIPTVSGTIAEESKDLYDKTTESCPYFQGDAERRRDCDDSKDRSAIMASTGTTTIGHVHERLIDDCSEYGDYVRRVVEVADAGMTTNDLELVDRGVQTSVSFVDLGAL